MIEAEDRKDGEITFCHQGKGGGDRSAVSHPLSSVRSLNHIIPVATHYQSMIAKDVQNLMVIYGAEKGKKLSERIMNIIEQISERTAVIEENVEAMVEARKVANKIQNEREKAIAYHDTVETFFQPIRYQIDKLELVVADELWSLPKYRELLFVR